ncbi:MAG: hypothetical protein RMM53_13050, partial [Bacteroidia bacterium]|nr:hypothetical protein [Bacteroidia bacterium]
GKTASAPEIKFRVLNPSDATPPELTVESPQENAVFSPGASVRVKAVAADYNSKLRDLLVHLFTETGTQNLLPEAIYISATGRETFQLDTAFTLPAQLLPGNYRVGVLAADARLNQTEIFRRIVIQ